ncbi:Globin-coupled histidine kinase [Fundidesulfovibrio magnetotacticus]|uniref:histidine kinase n=1 Tax=Fundidesulfovibrio magnetotacticus TaxID=2730080 RepID=A0A6V8LIQ2_9BACT|nr:ATP-binding protein [Fundidesulfovibrio magnetotacticus]GFK92622.1 Globin-coupled histidine kinase [Fundidesulfovibrio magnetotacticus]
MAFLPPPQDRLRQFRELLGLSDTPEANPLTRWADIFLPRTAELADKVEGFVRSRAQLRIILENQPTGKLNANWRSWFGILFTSGVGEDFMAHVWKSGQAHVIHNIDHRYVTLAYNIARAFLHEIAVTALPLEERTTALTALDRAVDFSMLVETDAFVTYATQCELEVIQGISHQVRNPVSVIGGAARKLLRLHPEDGPEREAAGTILAEAQRLERMAKNVNAYMDITTQQASFRRAELDAVLDRALEKLAAASTLPLAPLAREIDPAAAVLSGDPMELCVLFACLLDNAFQYADRHDPRVAVKAYPAQAQGGFATVVITNNGIRFDQSKTGQAFSPFHSTQPTATGFGLPMARVIASKYFGNVTLAPLEDEGTRCVVTLPLFAG